MPQWTSIKCKHPNQPYNFQNKWTINKNTLDSLFCILEVYYDSNSSGLLGFALGYRFKCRSNPFVLFDTSLKTAA